VKVIENNGLIEKVEDLKMKVTNFTKDKVGFETNDKGQILKEADLKPPPKVFSAR